MKKEQVRTRIQEIGIIPAIRVGSAEDAFFAADAVAQGGIPIVEITLTVPGALQVISRLALKAPHMIVGAGSVLDLDTARLCLGAGAAFLTSDGLDLDIVDFAISKGAVVFPGVLTPTEVIGAWHTGADFVKVVPCSQVGGVSYIKALKGRLPHVPIIAAGGVTQHNAASYIHAGAVALEIGTELIPSDAVRHRQPERIAELAHRFVGFVKTSRAELAAQSE